jgi:hypothetical protein
MDETRPRVIAPSIARAIVVREMGRSNERESAILNLNIVTKQQPLRCGLFDGNYSAFAGRYEGRNWVSLYP